MNRYEAAEYVVIGLLVAWTVAGLCFAWAKWKEAKYWAEDEESAERKASDWWKNNS